MNRHATFVLAVLPAILWGCGYPKAAEPPAELTATELEAARATDAEADAKTVTAGREVFVAKCGECHDHPDVMAIADGEWAGIVEEMGEKAEISKAESKSVLKFILAVRAARARAK